MRQATIWNWAVALVAALILIVGCDDSSNDSGPTELTVGTTLADSIDANGTNSYRFTAISSFFYQVEFDPGAAVGPDALRFSSDDSYICVDSGSAETCTSVGTLTDGISYEFEITELLGADTQFTIVVDEAF